MKKIIITSLIFICLTCSLFLFIVYNKKSSEKITLKIVEQVWTDTLYGQPDPKVETKEIKIEDKIKLESSDGKATMVIWYITENKVSVYFKSKNIARMGANGTIDLNSYIPFWIDRIKYNEEYRISTKTMGGGTTWYLTFEK